MHRKVIFMITYPNGKIFVGKDADDNINNFGDADPALVAADFNREQRRSFAIRKEILWESAEASDEDLARVALAYIRSLGANDPAMGYNRFPPLKGQGAAGDTVDTGAEPR